MPDQRGNEKAAGQEFPDTIPAPRKSKAAGQTPDERVGRLGTTGETTDMQRRGGLSSVEKPERPLSSQVTENAGRDRRFALREGLYAITKDKGLKGCGRSVVAGGVSPMTLGSVAYFAGVVTCGKVHLCPCCGAKIRSARSIELQAGGTAWECARCGLAMMTLTMRHYERHTLKELVDQQREAWKLSFGMNAGREWRRAKDVFEIEGYVRAWECTHGHVNGWHPHYHVLLFTQRPWTVALAEDFEALAYRLWSDALGSVGAYLPNEEHGVDIQVAGKGDANPLARYLMKFQDGKAGWTTADEMVRGQDAKSGRLGRRTPFQIASDFLTNGDAADLDLWHEFEAGARGIRALYWSNGLRKLLAGMGAELDERTDAEIAAEERGGEPVALIPSDTWYRHVVRVPGRALALLKAAERKGQNGVRLLIAEWGLVWGEDVLPPPVGGSE